MFSDNARPTAGDALDELVRKPVIEKFGFEGAMQRALSFLATRCRNVYTRIDADGLDPSVLKASNDAAEGGLTDRQGEQALALIAERFESLAVSFSSYDPQVDSRGPEVLVPLIVAVMAASAECRERYTA